MKKIITHFVFTFLIFVSIAPETEASRNSYWQYWQQKMQSTSSRNYRYKQTSNTTLLPTTQTTTNNYKIYKSTNTATSIKISANANQIKSITELNETPIKVLELGFSNTKTSNSNIYQEAVLIKTLEFEMTNLSGIGQNPENFELIVNDKGFDFEKTGSVILKFNNFRLANGENKNLNFFIKAKDPEISIPSQNGGFRIKLNNVTAQTESTQKTVKTTVSGQSVSNFLSFNLTPRTSGTSTISGSSRQIYSKTLSAGEKAYVLSLNLNANMDDFIVEEITVTNQYGNAIDNWVNKFNLIDFATGNVIDTTRFTNGKATFNLTRNQLNIARNSSAQLGFQVEIASKIQTSTDRQFKLTINSSDLVIFGLGAGNYLPDSQKYLTLNNKDFFVTQNGGGGIFSSANQPDFVSTGNLNSMYHFKIKNEGSKEISIGRISLDVYLSGVKFPSGISTDDFELREMYQGQTAPSQSFSTTSVGTSQVTFDALQEIYISGNSEKEFAVKIALENVSGGKDENDSINIKILGDSTFKKGSLDFMQTQSPSFIWSDQSGRPHSQESEDWFSGYLFPGLPTNSFVKYRR